MTTRHVRARNPTDPQAGGVKSCGSGHIQLLSLKKDTPCLSAEVELRPHSLEGSHFRPHRTERRRFSRQPVPHQKPLFSRRLPRTAAGDKFTQSVARFTTTSVKVPYQESFPGVA